MNIYILKRVFLILFPLVVINGGASAQKINIANEHPRLVLSREDIKVMRSNALSGLEPWNSAWTKLKTQTDNYVKSGTAKVYRGDQAMQFYQSAIEDGSMARDLSIAYSISGDKKYAEKAVLLIKEWSAPNQMAGAILDSTQYYPNMGMLVSRGIFTFLYAYDLLAADKQIDASLEKQFKTWLRVLVPQIKEGSRRWEINDYFGQQYYQNHIIADALGLLSIGIILNDETLVNYAHSGENNTRNIKNIIEGLILMKGQAPYSGEPGSWPVYDGEIMDRYRHFALTHYKDETTKPNRALQYAGLSTNLLVIAAEIGRLNGFDLYAYTAKTGENIKQPLLFYSDFYITKDASIKGGFYTGEDSWINNNNQATFSLWEVAHARYPNESKFSEVLRSNRRSAADLHLLGPVVLTHGRSIDKIK